MTGTYGFQELEPQSWDSRSDNTYDQTTQRLITDIANTVDRNRGLWSTNHYNHGGTDNLPKEDQLQYGVETLT